MDGKGNTQMRKDYQKIYEEKKGTVQDCLDLIQSGGVIYATNNYSEPREVLSHLHEIGDRVENVKDLQQYLTRIEEMTERKRKGIEAFLNG